MSDTWREFLYPLGFLAAIAFTSRALLQWLNSETSGKSIVTAAFWKISLCGNLLLGVHAFIQLQLHVCVIQACNGLISWRNLNLMGPKAQVYSTKRTVILLAGVLVFTFSAFVLQSSLSSTAQDWFRVPTTPWQGQSVEPVGLGWHAIGFAGMALFQ